MFYGLMIGMIIMSVVTFFAFGLDKFKAIKGKWRIRESTLLVLSVLMGAPGALAGMVVFRHKIRKMRFKLLVPLLSLLQLMLLCRV